MIRMVVFSLLCIIALRIYNILRKKLQRMLQGGYHTQARPHMEKRGILIKDPCTGEYYVR